MAILAVIAIIRCLSSTSMATWSDARFVQVMSTVPTIGKRYSIQSSSATVGLAYGADICALMPLSQSLSCLIIWKPMSLVMRSG